MHINAVENYSSQWGWNNAPKDLSEWGDEAVVQAFWNNTRYGQMTGDRNLDRVTPELRQMWRRFLEADDPGHPETYAAIRRDFEANGWYGSPC